MLQDAERRKFDLLLLWSLDRLTREGTLATLKYLELLESYGIRWRSFTETWTDSAGPSRDVVISLLASFAKQERTRIKERVAAGLQRARLTGTKSGKPLGRPRVVFNRDQVVELRRLGLSWSQMAVRLGASTGSVRRTRVRSRRRALPKPHGSVSTSRAGSKGLATYFL
jgi:DNA invertase Pin-like site-specific DNA recombinase